MNPFGALFRTLFKSYLIATQEPAGLHQQIPGPPGRRAQQRRQNRGRVEGLPERRRLRDPLLHETLKILHFTH